MASGTSAGTQLRALLRKDAALEWHGWARSNAVICVALTTLVLFSLAVGPQQALLPRLVPGFVWLALLLSSTLALGESMRAEFEHQAMEGLVLLALPPYLLFLAKAISNAVFLTLLAALLLPLTMVLYGASWPGVAALGPMAATLALGGAAVAAPGTLYAALAAQARAREVLLPLLLFPILMPGLLAAVRATTLIVQGDPMHEMPAWMLLLIAFNAIFWTLGAALFGRVVRP